MESVQRIDTLILSLLSFSQVSLSLTFPEVSACYWASFTQQRGWELTCGSGFLETVYRLQLREFPDGLSRRAAADWSATKLQVEISNVKCDLYGLEELDGKEETQEMTEVCYVISILFTAKGEFDLSRKLPNPDLLDETRVIV